VPALVESATYILLEETSTLCCLFVSRLVKGAQVFVDSGRWDLRPKDYNIEEFLLPSEVGGGCCLLNGLNDLGPLSHC
jgi:hypothetical protein